jgi:hypothetical protein
MKEDKVELETQQMTALTNIIELKVQRRGIHS